MLPQGYVSSSLPFWAVLIPLLGAVGIAFVKEKQSNLYTYGVAGITFLVVIVMYPMVAQGNKLFLLVDTGLQVKLAFMADGLSILAGLISVTGWLLASAFAVEYMRSEHSLRRYNLFSLLSLTGMMGVVFTANLFSLYIFFELLSVASYVMVIHEETKESLVAGLTYLFMGICGGLILLFSIIATYGIVGSGDLYQVLGGLKGHPLLPYIFWGYIIGFGVKAGLFPVHVWLPVAHPVAPSPASALLSGIMIKAGAYGIFRTIYTIIGVEVLNHSNLMSALLILALINIVLGSAVAIRQTEIKKMLAYSSISQIGYVILGAALLTPQGMMGGILHIFNHAIIKITLFLCAGAFIHQTGLRQLKDLRGIGSRMPITMICFTMAALSMIGLPPFNGFISKWFLALGALEVRKVGSYSAWVGITCLVTLLLSSFMNLVYYGPIIYGGWFTASKADKHDQQSALEGHGSHSDTSKNDDPNLWMKIPLLALGLSTLFFGIFPQLPLNLARQISSLFFH
ncbi:MAG: monovalent cation/H+ antiporter subunit D family protein [Candidatus Schekmanbacteria bacterium]|nr:monovalent cation/H+ antiporter subunit D family protein [Candidatus Schekmanbacteria bacterium]